MTIKSPTFGYRPGEARLFELEPGEALPEGWFDTPQLDPEPPIEAAVPGAPVVEITLDSDSEPYPENHEIDGLRARARELGIAVDRRWGVKKLATVIAEAESDR